MIKNIWGSQLPVSFITDLLIYILCIIKLDDKNNWFRYMYTYACIYNLNSFICIYFNTTIFLTNGNVYNIYYILYMKMILICVITVAWSHSYLSIHKTQLTVKDIYLHKICCSLHIFFNNQNHTKFGSSCHFSTSRFDINSS